MKLLINALASKIKLFSRDELIWSYEKFHLLSSKMKVNYRTDSYQLKKKKMWNANVLISKNNNVLGSISYVYENAIINLGNNGNYNVSFAVYDRNIIDVSDRNGKIIMSMKSPTWFIWKEIEYDIKLINTSLIAIDKYEFMIYCAYAVRLIEFQNN